MSLGGRRTIFPEPTFTPGRVLLDEGRQLARDWTVGRSAFLNDVAVASEHEYKLLAMAAGRVMQHAQIGYRDPVKSRRAYFEIWDSCRRQGVKVDRYGLCLDWSMALPRAIRAGAVRGTGMILDEVDDFVRLAASAPVAPHFGDFVLGFPAAVENTQAALAAGSTAIGNLGQYFTFRIPGYDDDVTATRATVVALGLIAAQPVPVMVHSNIDDGFAAQFVDLTSCFGMILIERDVIGRLVGAPIAHCYGHHFSDPVARLAFQRALVRIEARPGTIVYGNTTSYRGQPAANYASLAGYLLVDAMAQKLDPTGHAINAVPVTENERIPEIEEIVEAQLFAGRMVEHAAGHLGLIDLSVADAMAEEIVAGGQRFRANVERGLAAAGVDTDDVFEVLLALRRLGARRLEATFGAGPLDAGSPGGRRAMIPGTTLNQIVEKAAEALAGIDPTALDRIEAAKLRVLVATSDVHEHGKLLIEELLRGMSVSVEDGGVSTDPERLAVSVVQLRPDAVAVSTYNGVALTYFRTLARQLAAAGHQVPILIGGRLNQIPDGSNTSLPVDVGAELASAGAIVCREASDLVPVLAALAAAKATRPPQIDDQVRTGQPP